MALLTVHGLTKRFAGLVAVNDVSVSVPAGRITALIGPNGAGKTTCFNMIAGAMPPSSGRVVFEGRDLAGLTPEQVCALGIARTFQIVRPMQGLSVVDNVMVGALHREHHLGRARDLSLRTLERVGLMPKADVTASNLTLPDRKMLELARALATQPKILMLDEVMAGLRPNEADRVAATLRELNQQGLTIFLIEHVMRVVMSTAHSVIVLNHGEKIAAGTPTEIATNPKVIESYLGKRAVVSGVPTIPTMPTTH